MSYRIVNTLNGPLKVAENMVSPEVLASAPAMAQAEPEIPFYLAPNEPAEAPFVEEVAEPEINPQAMYKAQLANNAAQIQAEDTKLGNIMLAEENAKREGLLQKAQVIKNAGLQQEADDRARNEQLEVSNQKIISLQEERNNMKIVPWANKSTGQKIGAAIAMALGAVGQGLGGGPNRAIDIIQKSVEDDMVMQKEAMNSADQAIRAQQEFGNMIRVKFADQGAQRSASLALKYEQVANDVARMSSLAKDPLVKIQAEKLNKETRDLAAKNFQDATKADLEYRIKLKDFNKTDNTGMTSHGKVLPGVDAKVFVEDIEKIDSALNMINQVGNLSKDRSGVVANGGDPETAIEARLSAVARLMPGGNTEAGFKANRELLGDADDFLASSPEISQAKLTAIQGMLSEKRAASIKSSVENPGQPAAQNQGDNRMVEIPDNKTFKRFMAWKAGNK